MTRTKDSIESSAVQQEELDDLLRLMCDVFNMDFDAALPIFYSDPYFECENKRVLRVDGEIVSCLTVVERRCWLGRSIVNVAGIAGVATRPEQQRRGYAGRLLSETLSACKLQGCHLSALFPYSTDYYRKFGWEVAGDMPCAVISPQSLPESLETTHVRSADVPDMSAIARLYDKASSGKAFHCLRDEKRWQYLFTYIRGKVVYTADGQNIEGYLFYDVQPAPVPSDSAPTTETSPSRLRVLEIAVDSDRAKRGLIGHLARQALVGSIEYTAPREQLAEFGFIPGKATGNNLEGNDKTPEIAFMARILDWPGLIQAMLPNWNHFTGEIGLILYDPLLTQPPEGMVVTGDGKEARALRVNPERIASSCHHVIEGDVRGWTPTAVGHVTAEQACLSGALRPTTEKAVHLASQLFPERSPFLPTADHF